jgi:hypothetical protein
MQLDVQLKSFIATSAKAIPHQESISTSCKNKQFKIFQTLLLNLRACCVLYQNLSQNQNASIDVLNQRVTNLEAIQIVSSCAALPPSSPSGYYRVTASNGSAVRVYCDVVESLEDGLE